VSSQCLKWLATKRDQWMSDVNVTSVNMFVPKKTLLMLMLLICEVDNRPLLRVKCVRNLLCLNFCISQGRITTLLRCGGKFVCLLLSAAVKECS